MRNHQSCRSLIALALISLLTIQSANADELTAMVQNELVRLGYEPGDTSGELTVQTVVAISKFQSESGLEVTGEVTPQLAGILSAKADSLENGTGAPAIAAEPAADAEAVAAAAAADAEALRVARDTCIQGKMEEAQARNKKRRGFGSLMSAVSRTAGQVGSDDVAVAAGDVYSASATAADLSSAARDLGVTDDELEECNNLQL